MPPRRQLSYCNTGSVSRSFELERSRDTHAPSKATKSVWSFINVLPQPLESSMTRYTHRVMIAVYESPNAAKHRLRDLLYAKISCALAEAAGSLCTRHAYSAAQRPNSARLPTWKARPASWTLSPVPRGVLFWAAIEASPPPAPCDGVNK